MCENIVSWDYDNGSQNNTKHNQIIPTNAYCTPMHFDSRTQGYPYLETIKLILVRLGRWLPRFEMSGKLMSKGTRVYGRFLYEYVLNKILVTYQIRCLLNR